MGSYFLKLTVVRMMCLTNTTRHLQVLKLLVVDNTSLNWIFGEAYLVKQNLRVKNPSEVPKGCDMSHFWEHCLAWFYGGREESD